MRPLDVNQTVAGDIDNPYRVEAWTFAAAANTQVQFNLHSAAAGLAFDLTGPNGYAAFTGQAASSGPIARTNTSARW